MPTIEVPNITQEGFNDKNLISLNAPSPPLYKLGLNQFHFKMEKYEFGDWQSSTKDESSIRHSLYWKNCTKVWCYIYKKFTLSFFLINRKLFNFLNQRIHRT